MFHQVEWQIKGYVMKMNKLVYDIFNIYRRIKQFYTFEG